jgi:SAM-dependent methyltransferase
MPQVPFAMGRLRLAYRWCRYFLWSALHFHADGLKHSAHALVVLVKLTIRDFVTRERRFKCNICGWQGVEFYPNVGSGYFELNSNCPRCSCIHRYRSLAALLDVKSELFSSKTAVIEVAPVRSFQAYCLNRKAGCNYLSFDLEKFGMEQGDLTAMRFADSSCDYFICFHVLEHVPNDIAAIREIFRVLRPGGQAVLQVPIDWSLRLTVEYGKPNPLETGHVRRYSESNFVERLEAEGFTVSKIGVDDVFSPQDVARYGFNRDPIFFAAKPGPLVLNPDINT